MNLYIYTHTHTHTYKLYLKNTFIKHRKNIILVPTDRVFFVFSSWLVAKSSIIILSTPSQYNHREKTITLWSRDSGGGEEGRRSEDGKETHFPCSRDDVFSHWGLYKNKNKYHRLGGLNNKYFCPTVLKAGKSKIKVTVDSVSGKNTLPGIDSCLLVVSSHGRKDKKALWGLFVRPLVSFVKALPSWPDNLPKPPPPNTITLGSKL